MRVETFEDRMGVVLEDADPHPGPLPKREREHRAINNRELLHVKRELAIADGTMVQYIRQA